VVSLFGWPLSTIFPSCTRAGAPSRQTRTRSVHENLFRRGS